MKHNWECHGEFQLGLTEPLCRSRRSSEQLLKKEQLSVPQSATALHSFMASGPHNVAAIPAPAQGQSASSPIRLCPGDYLFH